MKKSQESFSDDRPWLEKRLKKMQEKVGELGCDLCIIEHPTDLLYLTGLKLSSGKLLVQPKGAHLFVDGRYIQSAEEKKLVPVSLSKEMRMVDYVKRQRCKSIGFDSGFTTYDQYLGLQKLIAHAKKGTRNVLKLIPLSHPVRPLRLIKDPLELFWMRESAKLAWRGFEAVRKIIKEGVSEEYVARELEIFWKKQGGQGVAFEPIIAFGKNSAMPHHHSGDTILKKRELALIDIGVILNHYRSDMTRVLFHQKVSEELKRCYFLVRNAGRAALKMCKPGKKVADVDLAARKVFAKAGVEKLFVHSLGHGIGLDTHEYPKLKFDGEDRDLVLQPNMVITIEPGLYLPGKGGVRYEDTIIITEDGYENLYTS